VNTHPPAGPVLRCKSRLRNFESSKVPYTMRASAGAGFCISPVQKVGTRLRSNKVITCFPTRKSWRWLRQRTQRPVPHLFLHNRVLLVHYPCECSRSHRPGDQAATRARCPTGGSRKARQTMVFHSSDSSPIMAWLDIPAPLRFLYIFSSQHPRSRSLENKNSILQLLALVRGNTGTKRPEICHNLSFSTER